MSRYEDRQNAKLQATRGASASGRSAMADAAVRPVVSSGLIASLDLGASKIGCFIMRPEGARQSDQSIRVAGVGYVQSKGIRAGAIIDMEAASQAIAQAVERAEAMANVSIQGVRVAVPGAQTASHRVSASVSLNFSASSSARLR